MSLAMLESLKVFAERNWPRDGVSLHFFSWSHDGQQVRVVTDVVTETYPAGANPDDRGIHIKMEDAQELLNQLWNMGFRPSEGKNETSAMNAKDAHIADLRKVLDAFINLNGVLK